MRYLAFAFATLSATTACGNKQTDFTTKHGIEVHSHTKIDVDRFEQIVDAFIKTAQAEFTKDTINSVFQNKPLVLYFTSDRIECPPHEDRTGECNGSFMPGVPGACRIRDESGKCDERDRAWVWLHSADCPAVSALTHELAHYLLWNTGMPLWDQHDNRTWFTWRDPETGRPKSKDQANKALENVSAFAACAKACPWLPCEAK